MNLNQHNPNSLRRFAIFALLFLLGIAPALAKPRLPAPPWPEIGNLFCESFDQPYSFPTNQTIDSAVWAESWSGYSLVRSRPPVQPFTVPMVNPGTNRTLNLDPERGAIRIWYQPAWSGGWTGQGTGPGDLARVKGLGAVAGATHAARVNENRPGAFPDHRNMGVAGDDHVSTARSGQMAHPVLRRGQGKLLRLLSRRGMGHQDGAAADVQAQLVRKRGQPLQLVLP